jgi:hypothetical protein
LKTIEAVPASDNPKIRFMRCTHGKMILAARPTPVPDEFHFFRINTFFRTNVRLNDNEMQRF